MRKSSFWSLFFFSYGRDLYQSILVCCHRTDSSRTVSNHLKKKIIKYLLSCLFHIWWVISSIWTLESLSSKSQDLKETEQIIIQFLIKECIRNHSRVDDMERLPKNSIFLMKYLWSMISTSFWAQNRDVMISSNILIVMILWSK